MEDKNKQQIAIGLFIGVTLALFSFIGTFAGNFLWEIQKTIPQYIWISGSLFIIAFLGLAYWFLRIAIKNLTSSTDYHKVGKLFKGRKIEDNNNFKLVKGYKEMREIFPLDIKKLKKEDKRFLLEKNFSEILFNEQMKFNNSPFLISMFALFVSLMSLMMNSSTNTRNQKIFFLLFILALVFILLVLFIKSSRRIKKQLTQLKSEYDILFKDYFNYAQKDNSPSTKNNIS